MDEKKLASIRSVLDVLFQKGFEAGGAEAQTGIPESMTTGRKKEIDDALKLIQGIMDSS